MIESISVLLFMVAFTVGIIHAIFRQDFARGAFYISIALAIWITGQ